jgi:DNA-binding GntR family transcriptional regulator
MEQEGLVPVSRVRLPAGKPRADALYDYLRQAILSGELAPNERLIETVIAAQSGVSRTPVREALHKLLIDQLVHDTGRGMVVRSVTPEQLSELCEVREVLEGMASKLASIRRPRFELVQLGFIESEFAEACKAGDVPRMVQQNGQFHEVIWQASGNGYLAELLRSLRERIERLQVTSLSAPGRSEDACVQHAEILEAISSGDADTAEKMAIQHFREAMAIRLSTARSQSTAGRAPQRAGRTKRKRPVS